MSCLRSALAIALVASLACTGSSSSNPDGPGGKADDPNAPLPQDTPKRIIWLIGDGMGVAQITGSAYAAAEPLAMLGMERMGMVRTHEHEYVTTDSAASATAMASGQKTHFEGVGVVAGTAEEDETDADNHVETVIDVAQNVGWRTGLVATTSVVDATPAAFAAHRNDRHSKDGIAEDLRHSGVDVMFGGGLKHFEGRSDGQNLVSQLRDDGYSVAKTATGLRRVADDNTRVVALLEEKDIPEVLSGERKMSLAEMTENAITTLQLDNDSGFFLMVEGSWIDRKSHEVDGPATIAEVHDFDEAVEVALEFARGRDDTLVIVTADHETGGLAIVDPDDASRYVDELGGAEAAEQLAAFPNGASPPPVDHVALGGALGPAEASDPRIATAFGYLSVASRPTFSGPSFVFKATHSATMVPVFAEGPGAGFVTAVRDNADLGGRVKRLVDADGAGGDAPAEAAPVDPTNVIVVVADGAGLSALSAAQYVGGESKAASMPVVGLAATHSLDRLSPDATGALTALSIAAPTQSGAIGVDADGASATTLLERAEAAGMLTGLVTTGEVAGVESAPLYAHSGDGTDSALAASGVDLIFGGGAQSFGDEARDAWTAAGGDIDTQWSNAAADLPAARLIASASLESASARLSGQSDEPTLQDMTGVALDSLSDTGEPFLLVVNATGVSSAVHSLDRTGSVIDELTDADGALAAALEFAAGRDDTAVVFVSLRDSTLSLLDNHYGFHKGHCGVAKRCGGDEQFDGLPVAVGNVPRSDGFDAVSLQGDFAPIHVLVQYAWLTLAESNEDLGGTASANFSPVLGFGAGARALEGFRTLDEVGAVIAGWLD